MAHSIRTTLGLLEQQPMLDELFPSRMAVIEAHQSREKGLAVFDGYTTDSMHGGTYTFTDADNVSHVSLDPKWTDICVEQLEEEFTHQKHVLRGTVNTKPVVVVGCYFLLKDVVGNLVNVGVYNTGITSSTQAQTVFPIGKQLVIIGPYYKFGMDGSVCVRVDDPKSVCSASTLRPLPTTAAEWHDLGNVFFIAKPKSAKNSALVCYTKAMELLNLRDISLVLSNRAAVYTALKMCEQCTRDCSITLYLNPDNAKAMLRLATSLQKLDMLQTASHLAEEGSKLYPKMTDFTALKATLQGQVAKHTTSASHHDILWCTDYAIEHPTDTVAVEIIDSLTPENFLSNVLTDTAVTQMLACHQSCQTWEQWKGAGNDSVKAGQYKEAIALYTQALNAMDDLDRLVKLCCNRSLLFNASASTHNASIMDATTAIVLSKGLNAKAWFRRAKALHNGGHNNAALHSCTHGLAAIDAGPTATPTDTLVKKEIDLLIKAIQPNRSSSADVVPIQRSSIPNKPSTKQQEEELRFMQQLSEGSSGSIAASQRGTSALHLQSTIILDTMRRSGHLKSLGYTFTDLPDYRYEFYRTIKRWPLGLNSAAASDYMSRSYEEYRPLPMIFDAMYGGQQYPFNTMDIFKRLHGSSRFAWYQEAMAAEAFGSICADQTSTSRDYTECLRHDFRSDYCTTHCEITSKTYTYTHSNQAFQKMRLTAGTVHVAVGFVDLSILIHSEISPICISNEAPLLFFGYEMSAFCVAKTLVIWTVMKTAGGGGVSQDVLPNCIVQMWFSTIWTMQTEQLFFTVVRQLCSNTTLFSQQCVEVQCILRHWSESGGVTTAYAVNKLLLLREDCCPSKIAYLSKMKDRIDMTYYELTGAFGLPKNAKESNLKGSVMWFDCPDGTPAIDAGPTVFSTVPILTVGATTKAKIPLVEKLTQYLRCKVAKLVQLASIGAIEVTLRCCKVEDAVDEIAGLQPRTVSWSNVLDYFHAQDFHQLSRACSRHCSTIHYGYSMNWQTVVMGVNLMDYRKPEMRKSILKKTHETVRRMMSDIKVDWCRLPLPENPLNSSGYMLQLQFYKNWVDWWIQQGRTSDQYHCILIDAEHAQYNPLSETGSNSIYMTWSYAEDAMAAQKTRKKH